MAEGNDAVAGITRRRALRDIGAATLGASAVGGGFAELVARASAAAPKLGTLKDIEHVIIFIQENRSFDHYFGTLSGVRGFDDKKGRSSFTQKAANGSTQTPFHLPEDCLPDLTHDWAPQHQSWAGGHMSGFVTAHDTADPAGVGPETMGYYMRKDVPFYYALADAFTICDGYHCSILGPTDPNRLMSMSASIDPAGAHGGPLCQTLVSNRSDYAGRFTWTTMPERLEAQHVNWKIYQSPEGGIFDNVLSYFSAYTSTSTDLYHRALGTTFPDDFMSDLAHNSLPKVSWLLASLVDTEHPGFSGAVQGEIAVRQVVEALLAHPKVFAKTALFITWDENGGFFDHVAPPTPPPGTKGEFLTVSAADQTTAGAGSPPVAGPLGLGFRVPMLVVSPFTRGGLVCSDVFDHTSTLRFIETRFGVEVPNLTSWRRKTTGDLTSAFNFAAAPKTSRPRLPSIATPTPCGVPRNPVTPPSGGGIPHQEKGKRGRPSGIVKKKK
jgi:phospholipase C